MRLIDADKAKFFIADVLDIHRVPIGDKMAMSLFNTIDTLPTIDPDSLRPKGLYSAHEVAEIIAELFGDNCACNFNGIDEWLPEKCELGDACPNAVGVACWEQYLKYREERSEHG